MIGIIIVGVLYVVSLVVCRLTTILLGSEDEKIAKLIAFVPLVNTVAAVIYIAFFGYIIKDNNGKNKAKTNEPETAKN